MQCGSCGTTANAEQEQCARCGAALSPAPPVPSMIHGHGGVPIAQLRPSTYGPPAGNDDERYHTRVAALVESSQPPRPRVGYRPVILPPPPPAKRRRGRFVPALVLVVLLALATLAGAEIAHRTGGTLALGPLHLGAGAPGPTSAAAPAHPGVVASPASAASACAIVPAPSAASPLQNVQLTTGLRDSTSNDFRPIDSVTTLRAGQRGYLTFQIATTQHGTVGVTFCLPTGDVQGSLAVPTSSSGRYGEFSTVLAPAAPGAARAILTWNGTACASLSFTVTR